MLDLIVVVNVAAFLRQACMQTSSLRLASLAEVAEEEAVGEGV